MGEALRNEELDDLPTNETRHEEKTLDEETPGKLIDLDAALAARSKSPEQANPKQKEAAIAAAKDSLMHLFAWGRNKDPQFHGDVARVGEKLSELTGRPADEIIAEVQQQVEASIGSEPLSIKAPPRPVLGRRGGLLSRLLGREDRAA